jgi:hypothetical protein
MERLRNLKNVIVRLQADLAVKSSPALAEDEEIPGTVVQEMKMDSSQTESTNRDQSCMGGATELETELGRLAIEDGRSRYVVSSFWASLDEEVCDQLDIMIN